MEANFELSINISEEMAEKLGLYEDTVLDAYYYDGQLVVYAVTEDDEDYYEDEDDESDEDEDDGFIDCTEDDCEDCEYHCPHCGACIIDDPEEM
jgi:hypothetical protein